MFKAISGRYALAAALLLASAAVSAAAAPSDPRLAGVWRSNGYGFIVDVKKNKTTIYDITKISCLKQWEALGLADQIFSNADVAPDGKRLQTKAPWALTTLYFERIPSLPQSCTEKVAKNDPVRNFDVFWQTFEDYYAFFKERGVDWAAIRETYRPKVTATTSDAELIGIFREIFRQLQDRHVSLRTDSLNHNAGLPPLLERWMEEYSRTPDRPMGEAQQAKIAEYLSPSWKRYLDAGTLRHVSPNFAVGTAAKGEIGYAMISGESGYTDSEDVTKDVAAATAQWDAAFAEFAGKRGLIIDMRINFGGNDEAGLALAGLLTSSDRLGFTKCARSGDGTTPAQHAMNKARPNAFTGPVIILISPLNWSAGENFAMMAKDMPNVLLVGDRTGSVHADVLIKSLPNGWHFTISSEIFVAADGRMYETVGIPPDVLIPYEAEDMKQSGIDPHMEKALHILNSSRAPDLIGAAKRNPGAIGRLRACSE